MSKPVSTIENLPKHTFSLGNDEQESINFLALDQSAQISGYAVFDKDGKLITYGTFKTKKSQDAASRLATITQEVAQLKYKYKVKIIFIEDIFLQRQNVKTVTVLAQVQGAILQLCGNYNIEYDILAPSHWRSILKDKYKIAFGRSRAEQKENAIKFVKEHYDKEVTSDEADAICLGTAAIIEYNKDKGAF